MNPLLNRQSVLAEPTQRLSGRLPSSDQPVGPGHHDATRPDIANDLSLPPQSAELRRSMFVPGRDLEPHGSFLAETALDAPLRRLARALGRDAARRHLARGTSIFEIALLLSLAAVAAILLAWSRQWH